MDLVTTIHGVDGGNQFLAALPVFLSKQAFPEKRFENEMIGRGIDPCDYTSEELEHITPQKKN